jgi:flagellin-like hook-associated protein FlgL
MSSINLSATSRTGLTVLRNVAKDMAETQNRLVTGKAVNSPMDNVSKFFTAASMDTRASALDSLMDNISGAQTTVKAASEGIKGIQGLIKEARSIVNQALTSSSTTAKVTGTTSGLATSTALTVTASNTITVGDGTTTKTYTMAAADTVDDVLTAINAAGSKVKASLSTDGKLQFENTSGGDVVIGGTATTADLATLGLTAGTTNGSANDTRTALAKQYDALRSEIDRMASDAGINGTNLLAGDKITLALNESGSSQTTIQGETVSSTTLGVAASTNSFQTDTDLNNALTNLINAADSLEGTAASFSSSASIINARSDFNSSLSDILKSASSELTAANMDQEAANLVALQTRQQMAATSLSIVQSSETTALRLIS